MKNRDYKNLKKRYLESASGSPVNSFFTGLKEFQKLGEKMNSCSKAYYGIIKYAAVFLIFFSVLIFLIFKPIKENYINYRYKNFLYSEMTGKISDYRLLVNGNGYKENFFQQENLFEALEKNDY